MIKKFINKYFVESVLVLGLVILCMVSYILANSLNKSMDDDMVYISNEVLPSKSIPVLKEEDTSYRRPYNDENIKIVKNYYDYQKENKEDTISYYENTYIENKGVDYANGKKFDVIAVADGIVTKVTNDDIVGITIKIKHNDNNISSYQSLSEAKVQEGDMINKGEVIGVSGSNKLNEELKDHLHFELYVNDKLVNPEIFFNSFED